jgi:hypothetical protein
MRSLLLVAGLATAAHASPMTVTGEVTEAHSRWTEDGDRIVTEATVHTDSGDVVVSQLGGSVDGLAMRTFPGPDLLVQGMRVTVDAQRALDLSGREHIAVDDVKILAAPPGYVRTGPTMAGGSLYWESGCVFVTIDDAGTKEIAGDGEFPVIDASIATWNTASAGCSYLEIKSLGRQAVETDGHDYTNIIKFRDASWCRPATKKDPARCHPESAAGITTATYVDDPDSDRDGAIVDADIELNGVDFSISVNGSTTSSGACKSELQNTLTHELGHLIGLEHTCRAAGDPDRVNDKGIPVPSCTSASGSLIVDATMYNYQDCGETKKETLEPDDIAGLCGIYPKADDPRTCEEVTPETPGCCQTGGGPGGSLLLSALVGLALFSGTWRRRR